MKQLTAKTKADVREGKLGIQVNLKSLKFPAGFMVCNWKASAVRNGYHVDEAYAFSRNGAVNRVKRKIVRKKNREKRKDARAAKHSARSATVEI